MAKDQQDPGTEDLFAGFKGEVFKDGERVESQAPESEEAAETNTSVPAIEDEDEGDDPLAAFSDKEEEDDDDVDADAEGEDDVLDGSGDDDADDADDADDDEGEGDDERRNKVPASKRIGQLTKARREAERVAAEEREQRIRLEERLAALEKGEKPKETKSEEKEDKAPAVVKDAEGNVLDKPDPAKYTYGEVDPDYINDVVNYNVEARMAKTREQEATRQAEAAEQQRAQEIRQRWDEIGNQGAEKYEDFAEIVVEGAKAGTYPLTKEMVEEIGDSDVASDIIYHLARNPQEAQKVSGYEPRQLARYIGRLEAAIQSRGKRSKETPAVSKAPPPPRRQARGAGGKFVNAADSSDFATFEAQAMGQDRKR
jgi:hypothetical protein